MSYAKRELDGKLLPSISKNELERQQSIQELLNKDLQVTTQTSSSVDKRIRLQDRISILRTQLRETEEELSREEFKCEQRVANQGIVGKAWSHEQNKFIDIGQPLPKKSQEQLQAERKSKSPGLTLRDGKFVPI